MPNQDNIQAKSGSKNTPNQAQTTGQIRLKLHAKSGLKNTPNQAQITRQIWLKLHAKSGSNYMPSQAQITPQIKPVISAACYRYEARKREKKHELAYSFPQTLLRRKGSSPRIYAQSSGSLEKQKPRRNISASARAPPAVDR